MSPLVSALPTRCVVALRSKHDKQSYLRTVHDESHGGNIVELSGDAADGGVMNPRCRFYLEPSKEHDGLVHVRCCYNNKYWVPQQRVLHLHGGSSTPSWIIGTADKPEEDMSKPSSTLFKHTAVASEEDGSSTCRFLHSQLGEYVGVLSTTTTSSDTSTMRPYLHVAEHEEEARLQDNDHLMDSFTVIDVSERNQLPKYLAFKGNNGQYLQGVVAYKQNWLQYQNDDIGDLRVLHTIFTNNNDGLVRIKSNYFDKFWMLGEHWIWPDSTDTTYNNSGTLFTVTTGADFIALRNMGNNKFCRRFTTTGLTNILSASAESITNDARVVCEEPVISRHIYDVDFRLSEARMYTTDVNGLHNKIVKNRTSTTHISTQTFTWTNTVESTWSSTVSMKTSVTTTLSAKVPFFAESTISVSHEFSGSYTWGKTETQQDEVSRQLSVEIPSMKKVTIKALGSNGVCDIPFSYKQRDVLINGREVIQEFTDGMYVGVKTSTVTFETTEQDLSDDEAED